MEGRIVSRQNATPAEAASHETGPESKKRRQGPSQSASAEETSGSQWGTGLRDTLHGDIFQLKLLMLFLIRGIRLKYSHFQLSTEMLGIGGKFDDLVFVYQDAPRNPYRHRFLQAKHKQSDQATIRASDLLNETEGSFSLQKYFRSYRKEIANRGLNVQDCILCTNIGFDKQVLESGDFNLTLIDSDDQILSMEQEPNFDKVPARYKLHNPTKLIELFRASSELHQLAKKLLKLANSKDKMTLNVNIFKIYHTSLVKEKVIERDDGKTWKFHPDFVGNLSPKAEQLRRVIFELWSKENGDLAEFDNFLRAATFSCSDAFDKQDKESAYRALDDIVTEEEIKDFFDKLTFAVDMPNEVRLGSILTKEVGQYFNLRECDFQSSFILEKMLDWFKKKQATVMIAAESNEQTEGNDLFQQTRQKMVALRATASSIDFRAKYLPSSFRESFQYQDATIARKAEELEEFLNCLDDKILQIGTPSPRCTTVKILAALDTLPGFKDSDDGYLLMHSKHLERNKHMREWVQGAMKEEKSHKVLVVIGETPVQVGSYAKELMPEDKLRKKMIFICSDDDDGGQTSAFERDEFGCELLSETTINAILSTQVTFQGSDVTVESLVGDRSRLKEILDSKLVEDILFHQRKVNIPAFDSNEFEKSLWIERSLLSPQMSFDDTTWNQALYGKCSFHPATGDISWSTENDGEKSNVMKKLKDLSKKNEANKTGGHQTLGIPTAVNSIPEDKLVDKSTVIITGVAGSGKSTILSRHYERVKTSDSNVWVIKTNLMNHSKYLSELKIADGGSEEASTSSAIETLTNFPGVASQSGLARSLLKNRLLHSGGIVLMLDGFDEINSECRTNAIWLMKALGNGKTKLDRLIVTTRPHLAEELQDALFQLALSLENLGKDHQVQYLIQYWQKKTKVGDELMTKFADSLVEQVSQALQDKEKTFIGIPLQCRILAECFQSQLESFPPAGEDSFSRFAPRVGADYNVAQLYHMLFAKKRDIFRKEKATGSSESDLIVNWALDEFLPTIDAHHLQLAIDTIFDERDANLLCPPRQLADNQHDADERQGKMRRYALQFGLTSVDAGTPQKLEFLHRTFAEYMVAEFLYKGFLSEDNKHKERIRDSDGPLRDLLIQRILADNAYEGVRVFLDSMLKEMTTRHAAWRGTLHQSINESRPNQLQRFARHFSFGIIDYLSGGSGAQALLTAIAEGNVGIFDLVTDCLGATYDNQSVQEIVGKAITNETVFSFFDCSVEIHRRVVKLLSDAEDGFCTGLLNLMNKNFPFAGAKFYCNFPRKAYLGLVLDFMEKHQKSLQKVLDQSEYRSYKLLKPDGLFIFDQDYDDELRRFIKLQTKNRYFVDNLNYGAQATSSQSENWANGSIAKILLILRDLNQHEILKTLSESVLTSNPELYQRFYGPCVLGNDNISELECLVSNGDDDAISTLTGQFLAAAVVGNEPVCQRILTILSTDQDFKWLEETGFIHRASMKAIKCCRSGMFPLIVRVVRRHFDGQDKSGREALRHLLILNHIYTIEHFDKCVLELLQECTMKEIVEMKITEDEDGSDLLSNVLLSTDSSTETANDFETNFSLLLSHVLSHYSNEQLLRFIRLVTSQDHQIQIEGIRQSIWAAAVARAGQSNSICDQFLKLVADRLSQEDVTHLLLHEENKEVVLFRTALMNGDENIVNKCIRHSSQQNRDFICRDFYKKAPDIVLNLFHQYAQESPPYERKIRLIHFLVDHAIDDQVLVNILTSPVEATDTHWECLFDHLSDETILQILTRISKLNAEGGNRSQQVVKKLLTADETRAHEAIIIRAAQQRGDAFVKMLCAPLSQGSEIEQFIERHAPRKIDEMFFSKELLWVRNRDSNFFYNALTFFLNHGNDHQLPEFISVVTTLSHVDGGESCSIWGSYIGEIGKTSETWSTGCPRAQACRKLEMLLVNVNRKLGEDSVMKLLLHSEGQQAGNEVAILQIVLFYVLGTSSSDSTEYTGRFTIDTAVLSREKWIELCQQLAPTTEQFLQDQTTSSYSKHQWMRALHFYLDYSLNANLSAIFFHTVTHGPNRASIWEHLLMDITPEVVSQFSLLLRHVKEKLGQDILTNLTLVKNAKGRFVLGEALRKHGHENNFKNVYGSLSTETRIEVFKTLFSDPYLISRLNVEIGSRSFSDNTDGQLLMYLDCARTVREMDGRHWSMWAKYVGKFGQRPTMEKFELFLKFVFDQLGEEYLKELVLHDVGDGESAISRAISQEDDSQIDTILSLLSPPSQTQVRQKAYTTTGMIEQMLANKGSNYWTARYLGIHSADGTATNLPDGLNLLASYFLDKFNPAQLADFVKLVTSLNKVEGKIQSIWGDYVGKVSSSRAYTQMEEERNKFSASSIDCLLNVVSNRLGAPALIHLLYHYDGNRVVICAMKENQQMAEIAFRQLDRQEKSKQIRFCPIDGRPEKQPTQQTKQNGGKRGKKQKAKK